MNKKSIIILIATAAFLIVAIAGFYVYADKALDYKDTAPEYKKEYRWAYRYGFKAKILSVDYDEKSETATAKIEILKNYNCRLGDYPTGKVFLPAPYAKYLYEESSFDEYLVFTKQFSRDDGTYESVLLIGVDGDEIFVINDGNAELEYLYGKGEFFKSLKEFEEYYNKAVEGQIGLDNWQEEHKKDMEREGVLLEVKYKLKFVWITLGGVAVSVALAAICIKCREKANRNNK